MFANRSRFLLVIAGLVALFPLSGCGRQAPDFTPYTPSLNVAEDAVRRGLDAWKAGEPPGALPGSRPVIHITDGGRKAGQVLESYRILGETRGSAGRTFAVILKLDNPAEEIRARYIVVGIDPLWVFRQEDYDLLMHWDHHMPANVPEDELSEGDRTKATGDGTVAPSKRDVPRTEANDNRRSN